MNVQAMETENFVVTTSGKERMEMGERRTYKHHSLNNSLY